MAKSRKRTLDFDDPDNPNEHPLKKRKLMLQKATIPDVSNFVRRFDDDLDQKQFLDLWPAINNSAMVKSLNVIDSITAEIAEYAVGNFVKCASSKCENNIVVLFGDDSVYKDHSDCIKVGYKKCPGFRSYFCSESGCMDLAKECPCVRGAREYMECDGSLTFLPDAPRCNGCNTMLYVCFDECVCSYSYECAKCDYVACGDCDTTLRCLACGDGMYSRMYCKKCSRIPPQYKDSGYCICNDCYVDDIIKCKYCDAQFPVLYKGHFEHSLDCEFVQCGFPDCDVFMCNNCQQDNEEKVFTVSDLCAHCKKVSTFDEMCKEHKDGFVEPWFCSDACKEKGVTPDDIVFDSDDILVDIAKATIKNNWYRRNNDFHNFTRNELKRMNKSRGDDGGKIEGGYCFLDENGGKTGMIRLYVENYGNPKWNFSEEVDKDGNKSIDYDFC